MSDWKQEFRQHMIDTLIKISMPLSDNPGFWGWIADNYQEITEELQTREIDYGGTEIRESSWESGDTFYQETHYGVDLTVKFVDSGQVKVRYEGNLGDFIQTLLIEIGTK